MRSMSSKPADANFSITGIEFPSHFQNKMQQVQQGGNSHYNNTDEQYSSLKVHFGQAQSDPAQQSADGCKNEGDKRLTNNCSYNFKVEYDSDATQDISDMPGVNNSYVPVPREDNFAKDYAAATSSSSRSCPSGVKQYACFVCDETFQELMLYTFHMQGHHYKAGSIKCSDCSELFENNSVFFAHRKLSTYELWVDRAKVLTAQQEIVTEELEKGDSSPKPKKKRKGREEHYICSVCGKVIHKYSSFLKHIATHDDVIALSCGVCQEPFRAPCLLRYHIDLNHSHVQPFQCRRCLRRFKLKCSLSTHMRYCDIDPSNLPYAEEMQYIDQLSQQRKYQGVEGEGDGLSQFSCPICTVMFDSPEDLKSHMNYHDETKPHKCDKCSRGFRSKHELRKHMPVHETKHECRCEICGVQLLTLSGYNAHLRGHRNQEKIQAKYFPEVKEDTVPTESAMQILERMRGQTKIEVTSDADATQDGLTSKGTSNKKARYNCPICGMTFHSGGVKFQIHARREHKEAEFDRCTVCNKTIYGKDNLERHLRQHKMFADTFTCDECGKVFRRKFALQVHKRMHSFKKFVKCDICGQEFRFVSEVEKHKNKTHRYDKLINIYRCSICGQKFPMLSHLSVHCYCHNKPDAKPFECDMCKVSYQTSVDLKKHIYEAHDDLIKKVSDSSFILGPDDNHLTFPNAPFADNLGKTAGKDKTGQGKVKNKSQGKDNNGADDLKRETESAHEESNEDTEIEELPDDSEKSESLSSVEKILRLQVTLPSNVEAYNLATQQFYHQTKFLKRYVCEVCQKAFSSNSDLKTHRRTHSGETPFKCDYCERSFKQRGHRKLHIQVVHTKEMPYKCDQCDSAFPTRYRYQIHIKRHSGVREHQCAYCDKNFYTLGKLNEHKKKRHSDDWIREQREKDEATE
ncbi:unnamed protein product [Candidula unifasciata]|uniref:C2H2-type domain-containing protein n=1 Tax=Candidula unifasciata TaxID=100452 RepID=A0A8S3ZV79_9EUPU|nr:unnamed protein product [Candidula unifasciata]